ncbi:MAG TPA: NUDIX hydrolase [Candidatus Saccharimonadales bacterium]|nr:NUDIX hydrolase [Candidatus Saccharimonadales bacterium]
MFKFCANCGREGTVQKVDATDYRCQECGWEFWNNAKTATALVFVKNQQLLVVKRAHEPRKGMYELAGGFVNFGESAYDCAIREANEELGITIARDDLELLDVYHNDYNPNIFTVDVAFLVKAWQGDFKPADDVAAVAWKPLSFIHDPTFCQKNYTGLDKIIQAKLKAAR